jgi:hypothetical protein
MPELGFVFWNRLGQDREERGKQIDALNPYANFLGKFVCGTICVLAIHRRRYRRTSRPDARNYSTLQNQ